MLRGNVREFGSAVTGRIRTESGNGFAAERFLIIQGRHEYCAMKNKAAAQTEHNNVVNLMKMSAECVMLRCAALSVVFIL